MAKTKKPERRIDCWNRIGVWGRETPRCERLKEVVHCRNCEVFVTAGRSVFERRQPPGYKAEWTKSLARAGTVKDTDSVGVIIFRLGAEWFSLRAGVFEEITESRTIHRVPHAKGQFIKGMVNVGGKVCLCHNLRAILGMDADAEDQGLSNRHVHKRLVVIKLAEERYVFPVDEVKGLARYRADSLKAPPVTINENIRRILAGTFKQDKTTVAALDSEALYSALCAQRL